MFVMLTRAKTGCSSGRARKYGGRCASNIELMLRMRETDHYAGVRYTAATSSMDPLRKMGCVQTRDYILYITHDYASAVQPHADGCSLNSILPRRSHCLGVVRVSSVQY